MSRTKAISLASVALGILLFGIGPNSAGAIYIDENQNWSLRLRAYSQAAIRLQDSRSDKVVGPFSRDAEDGSGPIPDSESQTNPSVKAGQLVQSRFFASPEINAKLTPYTRWMKKGWLKWLAPDDLRMRVTGWGFYDGIYDYGASQFDRSQRLINNTFNPDVPASPRDDGFREGGWYIEARDINLGSGGQVFKNENGVTPFAQIFKGYTLKSPRRTYGYERRLNEFYLSYSKGPLFLRAGKQTISWGESDTVALLDQTNPFSVLMGAPGFFQDIDEARIPLWTIRGSYDLFNSWGPFSSAFIEAYLVPGNIDTNTGFLPISTASPYAPAGPDSGRGNPIFPPTNQFVLVDHVPERKFSNSRYGFRLQTVVNRFLTLQGWFYRTYPQAPVPLKMGFGPEVPNRNITVQDTEGRTTNLFIVALQHKLTSVYGLSGTFFAEPLDGIVRINAQLFENEPGFIPERNLLIGNPSETIPGQGSLPLADVFRWEVGYDRFFFFRPLNPSNSFFLSASVVGAWNLDHTSEQDFRFAGLTKTGIRCDAPPLSDGQPNPAAAIRRANRCRAAGGDPKQRGNEIDDYIQQKAVEAQAQITVQSDWFHGKLQPRVTVIAFTRGTWAIHPSATWRWSDNLLFGADLQWIGGEYQSLGIYRDRAQISGRITYQLN